MAAPGPPGLDALLRTGGGVMVDRGDGGEDSDEMEPPRVDRLRMADAADIRRPLDEERSDEPRMRWLYLSYNCINIRLYGTRRRGSQQQRGNNTTYLFKWLAFF